MLQHKSTIDITFSFVENFFRPIILAIGFATSLEDTKISIYILSAFTCITQPPMTFSFKSVQAHVKNRNVKKTFANFAIGLNYQNTSAQRGLLYEPLTFQSKALALHESDKKNE